MENPDDKLSNILQMWRVFPVPQLPLMRLSPLRLWIMEIIKLSPFNSLIILFPLPTPGTAGGEPGRSSMPVKLQCERWENIKLDSSGETLLDFVYIWQSSVNGSGNYKMVLFSNREKWNDLANIFFSSPSATLKWKNSGSLLLTKWHLQLSVGMGQMRI